MAHVWICLLMVYTRTRYLHSLYFFVFPFLNRSTWLSLARLSGVPVRNRLNMVGICCRCLKLLVLNSAVDYSYSCGLVMIVVVFDC